jgi:hypothetical protein
LKYELWDDNNLVFSTVVTATGNGTFGADNPGLFTFNLAPGINFDQIKFVGYNSPGVTDATDFLVERITTDDVDCFDGFSQGFWKGHSNLWDGSAKYDSTFGVDAFGSANKNLLEAISLNGGGEAALARQAVAAFENALGNSGLQDSYRFSADEIKAAMQQAYDGATNQIFNTTKGAHLQNVLEFWNTVPEQQPGGELCSDDGTVVANGLVSGSLKGGSFDGSLVQILHDLYVNEAGLSKATSLLGRILRGCGLSHGCTRTGGPPLGAIGQGSLGTRLAGRGATGPSSGPPGKSCARA